ncbi:hypothetical protein THIBAULT_201 [Mycobacterium phage Thibault]|uniref:Uncharacterized protein n=1 Tax=Mycobacterium phage Thibault TaxID=1052673 RepID=G1FGR4_9CAUD|nr:hypothetical protein CL87_gp182 [Mycobacterium phage Thibault]AEJ94110.1 hypothetical protein THIBAULT_201 [Mycobacterium phage Thibault]AXF51707.1 hypothetical protein CONSTELLA_218 [Mycobacterium phage Constella]
MYGPKAFDIAGYTYKGENFTPVNLINYMVSIGELSPAARDMSVEDVLDQHAGALAIDRYDESSFDSSEFPKVIFWSQIEDDEEWMDR